MLDLLAPRLTDLFGCSSSIRKRNSFKNFSGYIDDKVSTLEDLDARFRSWQYCGEGLLDRKRADSNLAGAKRRFWFLGCQMAWRVEQGVAKPPQKGTDKGSAKQ